MLIIKSESVFSGIAIGPLRFFKKDLAAVSHITVSNTEEEARRFESARALAIEQIGELYKKALNEAGEKAAALFEVHQMMLDDPDFYESVISMIREKRTNAEYAVSMVAKNLSEVFSSMDDDYMKERAADILDISQRVQKMLNPERYQPFTMTVPSIVAADDLAPSETVQLDRKKILGFVMSKGSSNSHMSILARSMGIPAIIGAGDELSEDLEGTLAILDGSTGTVYIDPDVVTIEVMQRKQRAARQNIERLETLKGQPNVTVDGQKIDVFANVLDLSGIDAALKNDAGGIGLFRSEFIYMESQDYPTEEEQFAVYKQAAEQMGGRKVIIRTLDIGADKQAPYFDLPQEENPALGLRAIRICLTRPEIFKTQLRALYRASAFGNISIMLPMIISLKEIKEIRHIVEEVKIELKHVKAIFNEDVEIGIMLETPASIIISDELAKVVDFFSIGTNDLTQYTLAIDRQNRQLEQFCDTHHPAILKMIEMATIAAHNAGIWCGICGELAGDLSLTETFLRIGIDELSVSAGMVLPLREKIRSIDLKA
ncbi:MAG: phosphoenolpyruvate--protein phosphotransferase [Oscillospiraceae bacterium]|nr:phosphoenolpyruvate--protein phosphotransferase [Oscillospiraceae bacterium]